MVESFWAVKALSPNLKLDLSVLIDELKALPVGGDEAGTVGAGGEGDEPEMKITNKTPLR